MTARDLIDREAAQEDPVDPRDLERLRRFREGNVAVAKEIFGDYHRGLYAYALSITGDPAGSEDLVQEAFLRLLTYAPDRAIDSIRSFLYAVTRNLATNEAKRAS